VYRRPEYETPDALTEHPKVHFFEAPLMHISASYIRKAIQSGHSVQYLVTEPVYQYLESSALYKS
jgi:nicotinate-nucleotide adenylyltransferase